ncbi:MAG: NTP transferase domain-containing protein [Novosphingobium sp.]
MAALLLAAGRGTRFGGGKLAADLCGRPVAVHAAQALASLPFDRRIAVVSAQTPDLPVFDRITLTPADAPISRSIATGIGALAETDCDAVLIALADMPLVPAAHFARLIRRFEGDRVATGVDGRRMVPAIFARRHFAALASLEGDRGAGALLSQASAVPLSQALALDVDCPADLALAARYLQGR